MPATKQDLIGKALMAFFNGKSKQPLVVHSDISPPDIIPVERFFRAESQLPDVEKKALELCRGKVLDVGAGAGCHSVLLQDAGLEVNPIDTSEGAVQVMKARGLTNAREINFFDLNNEKFDTILLLMNGIGICGTLERLEQFFQKAKKLLKPGGSLVFDSSDIIYMFKDDDGNYAIDLNADYYGEVTYRFQYGQLIGEPFKWLYLNFDLLEEYAARHGFHCELAAEGLHFDYLALLTVK
jgi:SAM-dependent methyltransferase